MQVIDIVAILFFFALLLFAIFLYGQFYVCDNQTCSAFSRSGEIEKKDTDSYLINLQNEIFGEAIWPVTYIAASISTPISLWFLSIPFTIKNFAYIFLVTFAVFYFMISFIVHHYTKPITKYTVEYLTKNKRN